MQINLIINGDSETVLKDVPENSVELTVTSPPYFNAREYSQYETYKTYLATMKRIFTEVYRVTKPSRMCIVNVSPVIVPRKKRSEQSYRIPIPYHFVPMMEDIGFEFLEDIIWKKPDGAAVNRRAQFYQSRKPVAYKPNLVAEYILVFKKPAPFLFDAVLKDEPITDTDIEWTNVWEINPETKSKHPAPFPEELVRKCVSYYSYKGELVLDPFCGSGTTPFVANKMERRYIGIELNPDYVEIAKNRLGAT
jgi:DNA modification methylase